MQSNQAEDRGLTPPARQIRSIQTLARVSGLILLVAAPLLADDSANQLTLSDLAAYRLALSGKATADDARAADPPVPASFRDLWAKPDALKGRRVEVRGRIERVFHQGPVGQFPALVQAWAFSPSGDPFCLVYPDPDKGKDKLAAGGSTPNVSIGRDVRFAGTFLKVVEYPAGDGPRLAPMIVGDRSPEPLKKEPATAAEDRADKGSGGPAISRLSTDLIVGLGAALAVAIALAMRHFSLKAPPRRAEAEFEAGPPLEFVPSGLGSEDRRDELF